MTQDDGDGLRWPPPRRRSRRLTSSSPLVQPGPEDAPSSPPPSSQRQRKSTRLLTHPDGQHVSCISPAGTGDLLLTLRLPARPAKQNTDGPTSSPPPRRYLVDTHRLRSASRFFDAMLGSHRFAEGVAISDAHAALRARGIQPSEAPIDALPRIEISDVGQVMMATGDGEEAGQDPMLDFLRILHGEEDLFYSSSRLGKRPSTAMLLTHIANLAVMADRFGCVPCVAMYLKEKDVFHLVDSRTRVKGMAKTGEESPRQKVLVGWVFDVSDWFFASSVRLVIGGSSQWTVTLEGLVDPDQRGLWWHLPDDVEAELLYRRERILDVLNSLQMHFIGLYTSRERQCKLGYDSSPQCDSFQLGEMIRFFTRVDTIKMQGKLTPDAIAEEDAELDGHTGDIERLIVTMRQCPSYQIDRNHTHCGIRTKLIPALDYIQALVICESGLCRQCWVDDRANYRWSEREPAGHWTFRRNATATTPASSSSATGAKGQSKERPCKSGHRIARALFTASTRDWNPKP